MAEERGRVHTGESCPGSQFRVLNGPVKIQLMIGAIVVLFTDNQGMIEHTLVMMSTTRHWTTRTVSCSIRVPHQPRNHVFGTGGIVPHLAYTHKKAPVYTGTISFFQLEKDVMDCQRMRDVEGHVRGGSFNLGWVGDAAILRDEFGDG